MDKEHIKYSHFWKALTCQRFFIWNDLQGIENQDLNDENFLKLFWEEINIKETETYASEIVARTFFKFDNFLLELLIKQYQNYEIIKGKTLEDKIINTKKLLNSKKLLINPVFEYQGCVSTPFAFDSQKKFIINIKYSTKTKRKDFLKAFYDYSVVSKNIEVNDYYLYLPRIKNYKKNEIDLFFTNKIHFQKGGIVPGTLDKDGNEKNILVIDALKDKNKSNKTETPKTMFPHFEEVIKRIKEAKNVANPSLEELVYDNTTWGTNTQWNELLEYLNHPFAWVNGKIISKRGIIEENEEISSIAWKAIKEFPNAYIPNDKKEVLLKIMKKIDQAKEIVWYDFEGFSLPYAPLDNVLPFHQIVFQVSKIVTLKNQEVKKENLVIDPQNIVLNDLYQVIETVYSNKKDKYIVYNKSYENTRLKEMVILLEKQDHTKAREAKKMVNHIIDNTIDLYEVFAINSKNKKPMVVLNDQKGKTSIKNVEKHINKNKIPLLRKIVPYQNLEVSNGLMAMENAIKRSLNLIGNKEWPEKEKQLKKYCENDVRAMIMVYDFIKYILKK